jgi:hypothetical protein
MVSAGMAWTFTRYSSDNIGQERAAIGARLGVHAHDCMKAWTTACADDASPGRWAVKRQRRVRVAMTARTARSTYNGCAYRLPGTALLDANQFFLPRRWVWSKVTSKGAIRLV